MSCSSSGTGPLVGLRVIELSDQSASFAGRLLVDLGAEVVKIEPPGGDPARKTGPFINNQSEPDNSLSYWYNNSDKRVITLDIISAEGRGRFKEMAADCDAVIETYTPGYLSGIGLGYAELAISNPRLIMASVTAFGQSGLKSSYKSCDIVASAAGGQMYVCGRADRAPLKPYGGQPYYLASLCAAVGIMLALRWRSVTGQGQHIDISLQEATAASLDHVLVRYFSEGVVAKRQGSMHWSGSSDLFPCRDGRVLVSYNREWDTLVELLAGEGLGADFSHPDWKDEAFRQRHLDIVDEALSLWTSLKSREKVFELGQSMRLPWAALNDIADVFSCPQLNSRGYFKEEEKLLTGKPFKAPRAVINFEEEIPAITDEEPESKQINLPVRRPRPVHVQNIKNGLKLPLQGLRMLDFTWMLAGPYATRILADFGAEVIKVQSLHTATGAEDNRSAYFAAWNRGKLGITLDLNQPEAREVVLELAGKCDVVIENFTPRVMPNWGLDYEHLKKARPDLIMVSLSGFGQTGPWRGYAALGSTLQALCGLTQLTSYENGVPYGLGFAQADHVAGLYAALAVLAALERRERTGQGAYIDISAYEAACSLLGPSLLDYAVNAKNATPSGNRPEWMTAAPFGCYRCRGDDRWCVIAVLDDGSWQKLCRIIGDESLAQDIRFTDCALRVKNANELDEVMEAWTSQHSAEQVADLLQKDGIPASAVYDARDLATDTHLRERGFFTSLHHPALGDMTTDTTPIHLSASPARILSPAPLLGQHNREVFLDRLGMEGGHYQKLVRRGIIA